MAGRLGPDVKSHPQPIAGIITGSSEFDEIPILSQVRPSPRGVRRVGRTPKDYDVVNQEEIEVGGKFIPWFQMMSGRLSFC